MYSTSEVVPKFVGRAKIRIKQKKNPPRVCYSTGTVDATSGYAWL